MDQVAVCSPKDKEDLFNQLKENKMENIFYLNGGTDLVIKLRNKDVNSGLLINLSNLNKEMNYIEEEDGVIKIGSAVTFARIENSPLIKDNWHSLIEASSQVGSVQIRNRGTLSGNLANASPAGDIIPTLMSLKAKAVTRTIDGKIH